LRRALDDGVRTRQLPADLDLDAVTSMLCGALYGQYLTAAGLNADWAERVLEVIWPATVAPPGSGPDRPDRCATTNR
jgi:hypothetical protein